MQVCLATTTVDTSGATGISGRNAAQPHVGSGPDGNDDGRIAQEYGHDGAANGVCSYVH